MRAASDALGALAPIPAGFADDIHWLARRGYPLFPGRKGKRRFDALMPAAAAC